MERKISSYRVAARYLTAHFKPGDYVFFGKFKNKRARVVRIFLDERGIPYIEIEPVPKGRKKNRTMGLYSIRKMTPEAVQETKEREKAEKEKAEKKKKKR